MVTVACLPAYNEEQKIFDVVKNTLKFVDKVIVCDDGSNDQTLDNAKEAGAIVTKHSTNRGKGAAMRTLFDYAKKIDGEDVPTQIIPEFGTIAVMILGISIISIIAVTARSKVILRL